MSASFNFRQLAALFALCAVALLTAGALSAWDGPTAAPPEGNVAAPVNVGAADQIKDAGLGLNSLAVYGNAQVTGFLGVGVAPTQKLDVAGFVRSNGLCLAGSCITSWPEVQTYATSTQFGGMYTTIGGDSQQWRRPPTCATGNPFTGGACSCPASASQARLAGIYEDTYQEESCKRVSSGETVCGDDTEVANRYYLYYCTN